MGLSYSRRQSSINPRALAHSTPRTHPSEEEATPEMTPHNWPHTRRYTLQSGATICPQTHIPRYIVPADTHSRRPTSAHRHTHIMTTPQSPSHSVKHRCKKPPDTHTPTHTHTGLGHPPTQPKAHRDPHPGPQPRPGSNSSKLLTPRRQGRTWRAGTPTPPILRRKHARHPKETPPAQRGDTQVASRVCANRHSSSHKD